MEPSTLYWYSYCKSWCLVYFFFFFHDQEVGVIYTHHQKTVLVDADAGDNRRRIIAFLGGLDLCDGRYDTPRHALFRTLQTSHSDDYHNPTYTVIHSSYIHLMFLWACFVFKDIFLSNMSRISKLHGFYLFVDSSRYVNRVVQPDVQENHGMTCTVKLMGLQRTMS